MNTEREIWWVSVLRRDANDSAALTDCVFCNRPPSHEPSDVSMIALWETEDQRVFAAGVYCAGLGPCLSKAKLTGNLLDFQLGQTVMVHVEKLLKLRSDWDASALRRFVLIGCKLGGAA